jgi:hypothetical protein
MYVHFYDYNGDNMYQFWNTSNYANIRLFSWEAPGRFWYGTITGYYNAGTYWVVALSYTGSSAAMFNNNEHIVASTASKGSQGITGRTGIQGATGPAGDPLAGRQWMLV